MGKFKYYFLLGSFILGIMGCLLKLEGYSNYTGSMIGGTINFFVFLYFHMADVKRKNKQVSNQV